MNPLLIKAAPYAVAVTIAITGMAWAYDNGRDTEREKWQAKEAAAVLKMRERESAMQAQVDAAAVALSEKQQQIEGSTAKAITNTRTFYVTRPDLNVQCLGPDRLRAIADSDTRATAASAAQ